jgi:hypothetical protein
MVTKRRDSGGDDTEHPVVARASAYSLGRIPSMDEGGRAKHPYRKPLQSAGNGTEYGEERITGNQPGPQTVAAAAPHEDAKPKTVVGDGQSTEQISDAHSSSTEPGHKLLQLGARETVFENAQLAAKHAAYLAVPLILYFVWTTLGELANKLSLSLGALLIVIGLIAEAARWVITGFVFGYLYRRIPGHIGPVKALWFAGLWMLSGLAPTAIARGFTVDQTQEFVYRSAQLAVFVIALAVLIDFSTIKAAGGTWRDLRPVYAWQNYSEAVAATAPLALLVVTLAQQIQAGSGFEVAKSFLSGIQSVVH